MTKKNYPDRNVDGVPIGSTEDAETNRKFVEATIADGEIVKVLGADGRFNGDLVSLLSSLLIEARETNWQLRRINNGAIPDLCDLAEVGDK